YIKKAKILIVSGTALAQRALRAAVLQAIKNVNQNNVSAIFALVCGLYTWRSAEETAVYYSHLEELSDVVIGNREEYDKMENLDTEGDNDATVKHLFQHGTELIVIKHGVDGSYAYEPDGTVHQGQAYKTKVLKTFGAGDSYASAFLYALLSGKDYETALKFGSASASIVVSKHSSSEA